LEGLGLVPTPRPRDYDQRMKVVPTALTGLGIGLMIATVNAFVNRGDVPAWTWLLIPVAVCVLFLILGGYIGRAENQ
jgi:hypothetical protein